MTYSPKVYIDLTSDGTPGWKDITTDVLAERVNWEYGIRTNRVNQRVAGTGFMYLKLDNRDKRYSPNSTDCMAGFGIGNRVKIVFEGDMLDSDFAVAWSSEVAYSDYIFGDGLYHARSTDRIVSGVFTQTTTDVVYAGSDLTISLWARASTDETWAFTTDNGFSSDALYADVFDMTASFDTDTVRATLTAYDSSGTYAVKSLLASLTFSTDVLTAPVPAGTSTDWVHIAFVVDVGASMSIYVNGTKANTSTCVQVATSDLSSAVVTLFKKSEPSFLGSLAHLAVFGRALSGDEVAAVAQRREFQRDILYTLDGGPPAFYWRLGGANSVVTAESGTRTASADEFTKFVGTIMQIRPSAGIGGEKVVELSVHDWMGQSARYNLGPVPVLVEQPSGTFLRTILDYTDAWPLDVDIDDGLNLFTYAADKGKGETPLMSEMNKLAMSEPGFVYVRGGATSDGDLGEVLVFEDRARRQQELSTKMSINDGGTSDSITDLRLERSLAPLYNKVRAVFHPVAVDAGAVIIYDQDTNVIPEIPQGGTLTLFCQYSDSDSAFETVGALDVQVPVRNVDYTISNSQAGGEDLTLDLREAIIATLPGNQIAYWMLTDASTVAIKDETQVTQAGARSSTKTGATSTIDTGGPASIFTRNDTVKLAASEVPTRTYYLKGGA